MLIYLLTSYHVLCQFFYFISHIFFNIAVSVLDV